MKKALLCIEIRESAKWGPARIFFGVAENIVASLLSFFGVSLWQWDDALLGFEVAAAKTFANLVVV